MKNIEILLYDHHIKELDQLIESEQKRSHDYVKPSYQDMIRSLITEKIIKREKEEKVIS